MTIPNNFRNSHCAQNMSIWNISEISQWPNPRERVGRFLMKKLFWESKIDKFFLHNSVWFTGKFMLFKSTENTPFFGTHEPHILRDNKLFTVIKCMVLEVMTSLYMVIWLNNFFCYFTNILKEILQFATLLMC
jgi:hypothetical protein